MRTSLNNISLGGQISAVIFCLLCFAFPSQAQVNLSEAGNAKAWLLKMSEAKRSLNFQISFVLLKPGVDAQPYLWRHAILPDGTEAEQLNLLNGPGREALRIGGKVSYFESNVPAYSLAAAHINGPLPSTLMDDPLGLTDAYDFVLVGRSRISGRAAQQIRVVSKDKNRFGLNLWLDQETGLLLKLDMVDLKGQVVEQIQVTELEVTAQPHEYFSRIDLATLPEIVSIQTSEESRYQWQLDFMPQGMVQVKRDVHKLPLTGGLVEYMMLSDGLVDVSVYLQGVDKQSVDNDILLRHESSIFLTRRKGNVMVTVIGKLPASTANAIAVSVSPVQP